MTDATRRALAIRLACIGAMFVIGAVLSTWSHEARQHGATSVDMLKICFAGIGLGWLSAMLATIGWKFR